MSSGRKKKAGAAGAKAARSKAGAKADGKRGNGRRARPSKGDTKAVPLLRVIGSVLKLVSGIAIVVGAATAMTWGLYRYARTTPRFALEQLEVSGARRMSEARVAQEAQVEIGRNIFTIDPGEVERLLVASPWIRTARVSRRLPNRMRVEIEEREAAAVVPLAGQLFLLSRKGEVFKAVESGDPVDLPVVTGLDLDQLALDRDRELGRIGVALDVLRHYERLPLARVHVAQEVHVGLDGHVTVTIGKDGVVLHLGRGPWRKKLMMASRVLSLAERRGATPGIVFLDNQAHPERVVVRMR